MSRVLFFNNTTISSDNEFDKFIWLNNHVDSSQIIEFFNQQFPESEIYIQDRLAEVLNVNIIYKIYNSGKSILSKDNKIAFFVANDTIAKLFEPIIKKINSEALEYKVFTPRLTSENAEGMLTSLGIDSSPISYKKLFHFSPHCLIMANDWSGEIMLMSYLANKTKIKTICIQESTIDLVDKKKMRMRWTDYIFVMGINTVSQIKERNLFFITGNPRYENLEFLKFQKLNKVFINCNFTYGIEEEHREAWMQDIISTLDFLKIDYLISKHPRDKSKLGGYKNVSESNAALVHNQLSECQLVISRFSSIIHESLFFGIPAIYYNPHSEEGGYDFHCDNKILFYIKNRHDLRKYIESISMNIDNGNINHNAFKQYLLLNCNYLKSSKPSELIFDLLNSSINLNISNTKNKLTFFKAFSVYILQWLYNNYKKIKS
jgi:hypothetical protein